MTNAVKSMIDRYNPVSSSDYSHILKQIIQEITLLGLWRGKFFEKAAFYGGTALRLFYGLDRFSEDLDFSLLKPDPYFKLEAYFPYVQNELHSFGFKVDIVSKDKTKNQIDTAFIKANTRMHFFEIAVPEELLNTVPGNQSLKVKFEVDVFPPLNYETEVKYLLEPIPFSVRVFKPSFLFSGKMHAVMCRSWQNRVKGRDWYDFYWYVKNQISLDLKHLATRMIQSEHLAYETILSPDLFSMMLKDRIESIDFKQAKKDVENFVKDRTVLDAWSQDFFLSLADMIIYN